jgi:hypothetical protein
VSRRLGADEFTRDTRCRATHRLIAVCILFLPSPLAGEGPGVRGRFAIVIHSHVDDGVRSRVRVKHASNLTGAVPLRTSSAALSNAREPGRWSALSAARLGIGSAVSP